MLMAELLMANQPFKMFLLEVEEYKKGCERELKRKDITENEFRYIQGEINFFEKTFGRLYNLLQK